MQTKTINWQGSIIQYKIVGDGKPVILLHGFGEDSTVWEPQISFLQNNFRLIIPDLPGTGNSQFVPDADIEIYAAIVKAMLDIELQKDASTGEIFETVCFLGHSMGGYICLAFAEKHPQYLNSFGLLHSSAFADSEEKKQVRKKAIEFINSKGANSFIKTSLPGLFSSDFADKRPEIIESFIQKGLSFSNAALVQYYEAMIARPDRISVLKNFPHPILFIIGEHDPAVPLESSLKQCYLPQQSHVTILSNSAHMGMWEETEKLNQQLSTFLLQL